MNEPWIEERDLTAREEEYLLEEAREKEKEDDSI
jgi:hypothetical protein